jgi:hypothetical protein
LQAIQAAAAVAEVVGECVPMDRHAVSMARAGRLYRLVLALGDGPQTRATLLKRLKVGVRTFFRDVELLRGVGIAAESSEDGYGLGQPVEEALQLLPFPNPDLTFGDVMLLMKGRSQTHRKLKQWLERTVS